MGVKRFELTKSYLRNQLGLATQTRTLYFVGVVFVFWGVRRRELSRRSGLKQCRLWISTKAVVFEQWWLCCFRSFGFQRFELLLLLKMIITFQVTPAYQALEPLLHWQVCASSTIEKSHSTLLLWSATNSPPSLLKAVSNKPSTTWPAHTGHTCPANSCSDKHSVLLSVIKQLAEVCTCQ